MLANAAFTDKHLLLVHVDLEWGALGGIKISARVHATPLHRSTSCKRPACQNLLETIRR
jgi:hypothetical protein